MEQQIRVKTETPPQRCEVCHQTDLFDPISGYCSRCNQEGVLIKQPLNDLASDSKLEQVEKVDHLTKSITRILYFIFGTIFTLLLCLMFGGGFGGILGRLINNGEIIGIVLGVLFGCIMGVATLTKAMKNQKSKDMKSCPYCAEKIINTAIKCRYCGSAIKQ